MRKFFYFLALLLTSVMVSCSKKPANEPQSQEIDSVTISNFNSALEQDFKAIKDSASTAVFYESQIVLNKPITEDSFEIVSVMNVFQAGEYCYQVVHNGSNTKTSKIHSWWLEDLAINPEKIITLDSALTRLNQANIKKPMSNLITLRKPVGPTLVNPSYYVGSIKEGFVKVDAITSNVTPVE